MEGAEENSLKKFQHQSVKCHCRDKFILSVSIIADIEQCPHTPPSEPELIQKTPSPLQYSRRSLLPSQRVSEQRNVEYIQYDEFGSVVPSEV